MYPHERSLVETFSGRPFALIGVNSDASRDYARRIVEKEHITWRSFYDGSLGPIARAWNVTSWPTIYLIDHRGVIRYKDLRGEALEAAIEQLVREAEAAGGPPGAAGDDG